MKQLLVYSFLLSPLFSFSQKTKPVKQADYFPTANNWQQKSPAELGLKASAIEAAVNFSIANEIKNPRNMEINHYRTFGKEPFGEGIGPLQNEVNKRVLLFTKDTLLPLGVSHYAAI